MQYIDGVFLTMSFFWHQYVKNWPLNICFLIRMFNHLHAVDLPCDRHSHLHWRQVTCDQTIFSTTQWTFKNVTKNCNSKNLPSRSLTSPPLKTYLPNRKTHLPNPLFFQKVKLWNFQGVMLGGFDEGSQFLISPKKRGRGPMLYTNAHLGGGFKHCLYSPVLGEMIQFDEHMCSMG